MTVPSTVRFRFYGRLNDFLPGKRKNVWFAYTIKGNPAVKDTIEAIGVVHVEVDCFVIDGRAVDFSYQLKDGDQVRVYSFDVKPRLQTIKHLQAKLPTKPKFVLDSHLGKLARHLRLFGFDVVYKKDFPDHEIIKAASGQRRMVLTRDVGLLKQKAVRLGYWIRTTDPQAQVSEAFKRFNLFSKIKPFSVCLECNGRIVNIQKNKILNRLPAKTQHYYSRFHMCSKCKKIYWQGSHFEHLSHFISTIKKLIR